MKIYILKGSTGRWEDSYEWVVRAYTDKGKADADCDKANEEADEYLERRMLIESQNDIYYYISEKEDADIRSDVLTINPEATFDGRTCYWVIETELITSEEST